MSNNPNLVAKYALYKSCKLPADPYLTYFGSIGSARASSQASVRGTDCFTITSISPIRPLIMENPKKKQIQNFRISSMTQNSSPCNSQRIIVSRGSIPEIQSDKILESTSTGSSVRATAFPLKERLEKKEKTKEIEKEEPLRIIKRQQSQKENSTKEFKHTLTIEQPKYNGSKITSLKEQISDEDKLKIQIYFRYKLFSLVKAVEEKAKNNSNNKSEPSFIDEIWKSLKISASMKRKYKCRDIVNFNKKLRETMRSLFPLNSPKSPSRQNSINLDDETSMKITFKKSKSSDGNKASALGEFIIRKKEIPSAKIFIIIGGYPALKKALEERGWIENPDPSSKNFNLKWSSKLDMKYDSLKPYQFVNHFEKNTVLTTKGGFTRNIRGLIWHESEDIDKFFPRCYDLNDATDFDDFLQDFKFEQAIATLRLAKNKAKDVPTSSYHLFKLKLCVSLNTCERRLKPFDSILQDMMKNETSLFTQEEWELMNVENLELSVVEDSKYSKLISFFKRRYNVEFKEKTYVESDNSIFIQAEATLARLERSFPQLVLNQGKNIWMVKPAGLSRGRGICCYNSLNNILDHISIKESEWVIQKYIENPLIIKKRKFDIRQWVLVTDWNPLTVWFYEECYVRFSAHDFNPDDLNNKFAHLTNNAIGKNATNFETSEIEGNMWDSEQLKNYLKKLSGKDIFEDIIKPQMKHIVIKTLLSGQDMLDSRKNSFELYGYDFMVDEDYKTWVLEINSSPSMDYSTSITERLVKAVLTDCVKVVVDYGMAKGEKRKNVDTGNFQCIYSGKKI